MRERSNIESLASPLVSCSSNRSEAISHESKRMTSAPSSQYSKSRRDNRDANGTPSTRSNRAAAERLIEEQGDGVVIEERRRRADGDGYTTHRYVRGRMLGKGGFAKVYLCTSMDTGKNYAVKIVPKANLVKARARQKVSQPRNGMQDKAIENQCRPKRLSRMPTVSAANRDQDPSNTQALQRLRVQTLL